MNRTLWGMPKRSSKQMPPSDVNQAAARVVALLTEDGTELPVAEGKNPAAVAMGRLGGQRGGRSRAERLTPERRSEIAREAARARWKPSEG